MSDQPNRRLARDEIQALKFAGHRQLARWAHKRELSPRQRIQRASLVRALRILEDTALADGCELRAPDDVG